MIPETIGRYEVQCLLGEGSFGQVFAARDPVLARGVAIKVLRSMYSGDPTFMARFHAEAASLARLSHANVTAIYDVLQAEGHNGMVMELVQGHTLEHVLRQQARLPLDETLAIAAQTVSGLGYIHRLGVVHRDIKPANIMLTDTGTIKIMDFGIARIQGASRLTKDGSAVGTLAYAAPEQIRRGEGVPASDQYSLACMIYEMLSGNPPFDAQTEFELMQAQIAEPPKPISQRVAGVSAEVEQALSRALAKDPGERFESVEQFGRALGLEAIQSRASAVAQGLIKRSDAIPPIPERAVRRPSGPSSAPKALPVVTPPAAPAAPAAPPPGGLRQSTPFLIMGAAFGVAAAVGAFIFLDSSKPVVAPAAVPVQVAAAPPQANATPPSVADTQQPAPAPPPITAAPGPPLVVPQPPIAEPPPVVIVPPPATVPAPPNPTVAEAPQPAATPPGGRPDDRPGNLAAPTPMPSPRPSERSPEPVLAQPSADFAIAQRDAETSGGRLESFAAPAEPFKKPDPKPAITKMPTEPPVYQGKVEDWLGGNMLFVQSPTGGVKKADLYLYGITDKGGSAKEAQETRNRLEAYAKGRVIKCWTRQEDNKQRNLCFLDNKDLALWALEQKLVKPSKSAPPEYLKVQQ
jgi:serine/threonine protein kinase